MNLITSSGPVQQEPINIVADVIAHIQQDASAVALACREHTTNKINRTKSRNGAFAQMLMYNSISTTRGEINPMDVCTKEQTRMRVKTACCDSRDESSTWFLGQDTGLPTDAEIYIADTEQTQHFSTVPITTAVSSASHERATWRAARLIQTAWRRCMCDPDYLLCRNRLLREIQDLIEVGV